MLTSQPAAIQDTQPELKKLRKPSNPGVPRWERTQSSELFNHYSLFKTSEQLLGLPFINHAKDTTVKSMAAAFHL